MMVVTMVVNTLVKMGVHQHVLKHVKAIVPVQDVLITVHLLHRMTVVICVVDLV